MELQLLNSSKNIQRVAAQWHAHITKTVTFILFGINLLRHYLWGQFWLKMFLLEMY